MNSFTIYVCESQPLLVEGLQRVIDGCGDLTIIGHASDMGVAIAELSEIRTDIFLIGQPFNAKSILPLLSQAREAEISGAPVLWIGEMNDVDTFRALQIGAKGIIRKTEPVSTILDCLRTVAGGSIYLEGSFRSTTPRAPRRNGVLRITRREREIIEFVCQGMKNKEIAEALSITPGTVKVHLMHIFEKTGVKDRFQLALQGKQFLSAVEPEPFVRKLSAEG